MRANPACSTDADPATDAGGPLRLTTFLHQTTHQTIGSSNQTS